MSDSGPTYRQSLQATSLLGMRDVFKCQVGCIAIPPTKSRHIPAECGGDQYIFGVTVMRDRKSRFEVAKFCLDAARKCSGRSYIKTVCEALAVAHRASSEARTDGPQHWPLIGVVILVLSPT